MKTQDRDGFSLTEISLVIVIISLIVAGIMGGNAVLQNMKIQKVIRDLSNLHASVNHFVETQRYLPGDFPSATTLWKGTADGNGDWIISNEESSHVMNHLHMAEDIEHPYAAGGSLAAEKNLKRTPFKIGVYWIHTPNAPIYGTQEASIDLSALSSNSEAANGALTPKQASQLDEKMDDGKPDDGEIYISNGKRAAAGAFPACVSSDAPPLLQYANKTPSCTLHYWLKR